MLRIFLFALLVCNSSPATAESYPAMRHKMEIWLNPADGSLHGEDTIANIPTGDAELKLLLAESARSVKVTAAGIAIPFKRLGEQILIASPKTPLKVSWLLSFAGPAPQRAAHDEDPGYGIRARLTRDGGYLAASSLWYPRQHTGQSLFSLIIHLPVGQWAVTAGDMFLRQQTDEENLIGYRTDYPLEGLSLATGPWEISEDRSGPLPIYTFFKDENSPLATTYLTAARGFLDLYQGLFGPYPFRKFAIVENFLPTGYGFPSWTLLGSKVIRLPFIVRTSLGHEIAHSWWGNGVRVNPRQGNWAEGLTTYVADYLYKEQQGDDAARAYRLKILRDYTTLVPTDAMPLRDFRSRVDKASQVIGYGKGAMLFHQLRKTLGDHKFWSALRHMAQAHMHQSLDWEQLLEGFAADTALPLRKDYQQWLERGDIPELQLNEVKRRRDKEGWKISGRLRQSGQPYPLQLEVLLQTETGAEKHTLAMTVQTLDFQLSSTEKPLRLTVDPDYNLMRRLSKEEIPLTVNSLRAVQYLQTMSVKDLNPHQERAVVQLLDGLRKTAHKRETPLMPNLYLATVNGLPEAWGAPGMKRLASGELQFQERVITEKDSFFCVWRNDQGILRALFIPAVDATAQRVAQKIPHYGKYSYLVFSAADNNLKGTWAAGASPLSYSWPEDIRPIEH